MKIALICTGTELLKGSCCNTDLAFAGNLLTASGMPPIMEITVGDHTAELIFALGSALKSADTVIISGGLGPTSDDITLETVARFFGLSLQEHPELKIKVETLWAQRHNSRCPKNQYKQALVPENSRYFANPAGVASGIGFDTVYDKINRHIFLLPGPPGEFETVFANGVLPELRQYQDCSCCTSGFLVCGVGETLVARIVEPLLKDYPVEIAYTAQCSGTKLFLSGASDAVSSAVNIARAALGTPALPEKMYSLPEYLVGILTARREKFGTAESCTGGLAADSFVSIPGASACFNGGIIAYDNSIKNALLQVPNSILQQHGAVSAQCAEAMVIGACKALKCDCAISTTGIAGPGGGTPDKPVGLVYVGAAYHGICAVKELHLRGNRRMVRERAVAQSLLLLRELLEGAGSNIC